MNKKDNIINFLINFIALKPLNTLRKAKDSFLITAIAFSIVILRLNQTRNSLILQCLKIHKEFGLCSNFNNYSFLISKDELNNEFYDISKIKEFNDILLSNKFKIQEIDKLNRILQKKHKNILASIRFNLLKWENTYIGYSVKNTQIKYTTGFYISKADAIISSFSLGKAEPLYFSIFNILFSDKIADNEITKYSEIMILYYYFNIIFKLIMVPFANITFSEHISFYRSLQLKLITLKNIKTEIIVLTNLKTTKSNNENINELSKLYKLKFEVIEEFVGIFVEYYECISGKCATDQNHDYEKINLLLNMLPGLNNTNIDSIEDLKYILRKYLDSSESNKAKNSEIS